MTPRPTMSRSADHLRLVVPPVVVAGPIGLGRTAVAAKPKVVAAAAKSLGDWVWHGLGIGAATASAGFATYAMIFSTGEVVPSGNFNIFARYDRLYQAPAARHAPPASVASASPQDTGATRTNTADKDGVDFNPTGSVATDSDAPPGSRANLAGRTLPNYTLRDVFDGKALVESRASLSVVKPGSVLDGAGEVLSIEKRGDQWVVLTRNGMITGQRR